MTSPFSLIRMTVFFQSIPFQLTLSGILLQHLVFFAECDGSREGSLFRLPGVFATAFLSTSLNSVNVEF